MDRARGRPGLTGPGLGGDEEDAGAGVRQAGACQVRAARPEGSGSTAKVPGSMSTGSWSPFPKDWWAWTGRATCESGAVSRVPHPAHRKTYRHPPYGRRHIVTPRVRAGNGISAGRTGGASAVRLAVRARAGRAPGPAVAGGEDGPMEIGYKLAAEAFGPRELVRQAVRAEAAGFDFVEMSDHFHPWLEAQGHSPFAWTVLGAIAARTERIGLATGVTCPTVRYHPAVVAQAAATLALLCGDRFVLGVGAGERLNEHVVGPGFPQSTQERHERLREALEIIRLLWQGGYRSYEGTHLRIEDARVFDLPERPPLVAVAAGGPEAARLAAELGDGLFATEERPSLVEHYRAAGGSGPRYAEVPVAWAPDEGTAAEAARETSRWAVTGWKVMSELPNPVNFEAATRTVRTDDILRAFTCGPDPERYAAAVRRHLDAGFDRIVLMNAGPDPDGFLDFYARELDAPLRRLRPSG